MLNSIADNVDLDDDDEVRVEQQSSSNLEGRYFVFLIGMHVYYFQFLLKQHTMLHLVPVMDIEVLVKSYKAW